MIDQSRIMAEYWRHGRPTPTRPGTRTVGGYKYAWTLHRQQPNSIVDQLRQVW
jgi:hypothetical protein